MPDMLHYLRIFEVHPLAGVIIAALLAALIEQRMARRGTADFSAIYRDDSPPKEVPPKDIGAPRASKR